MAAPETEFATIYRDIVASDAFWQLGQRPHNGFKIDGSPIKPSIEEFAFSNNERLATEIGSIVLSMKPGDEMINIPYGQALPLTDRREVIKAVIDTRRLCNVTSYHYRFLKKSEREHTEALREIIPDYTRPTYEECFRAIENEPLPVENIPRGLACSKRGYLGRTIVKRHVEYLKYDDEIERFIRLDPAFVWNLKHNSELKSGKFSTMTFPPYNIGEVYDVFADNTFLESVTEATLLRPSGVHWRTINGKGEKNNQSETDALRQTALQPQVHGAI